MRNKSKVQYHLISLIESLKNKGKQVYYIRCDNAGEHEPLKQYCDEKGINLEMTAPNTPQHNGVVERSFETDLNCVRAMLYQANFTTEMATKLWGMAVLYLQYTRNMSSTMANEDKMSPNSKFNNEDDLNITNMQPFGRIGFVTIRNKMKRKLSKRSFKAIMVGIPKHHSNDNYYMYNPETKRIIISRDIKWAPFERPTFYEGLEEILKP